MSVLRVMMVDREKRMVSYLHYAGQVNRTHGGRLFPGSIFILQRTRSHAYAALRTSQEMMIMCTGLHEGPVQWNRSLIDSNLTAKLSR